MFPITRAMIADMVENETCIGKTVELHYTTGPNAEFPVYMTFTGYSTPFGEPHVNINYILHNKNTETYYTPTAFSFSVREFCIDMRVHTHRESSVFVSEIDHIESTWEV